MNQTLTDNRNQIQDELTSEWTVIIFNNDVTSMEEVVMILMLATQCSLDEAETECFEAHTLGKCRVHFADKIECERVANIISQVGVQTEICKEWVD